MKVFKRCLWIVLIALSIILLLSGALYIYNQLTYRNTIPEGHKVVVCIPVYGQSLALGEKSKRITDFGDFIEQTDGRVVSEYLDYAFGYYDAKYIGKQNLKKFFHYRRRSYELSVYGMAESLVKELGRDTVLCIFPSGAGMSAIDTINKPCIEYDKFIYEIKHAYQEAKKSGWDFYVAAICWMQGESDIIDYTTYDYQNLLKQFRKDAETDIKAITHQNKEIPLILYQSNVVTKAKMFNPTNYNCIETRVAQSIVNLLSKDNLFWASGPTYPYNFAEDALHIDGYGQKLVGNLAAISALNIIRGHKKFCGLIPLEALCDGNDALIKMNVPCPPLRIDTVSVYPIKNYGFSVITPNNRDIADSISIEGNSIRVHCSQSPIGCKIRYAVNGEKEKSGYKHGPRGNLRDSQGDSRKVDIAGNIYPLNNWCYQFDIKCQHPQ